MQKLNQEYQALYNQIINNTNEFSENEVSVFTPAVGEKYNSKLLVYGRAVNGWYGSDYGGKDTVIPSDYDVIANISSNIKILNTRWIEEKWGNGSASSTSRSPFFRFTRRISELLGNVDGFQNIAWSNIYKVSKVAEGNPSEGLCRIQEDICKQIFRKEIEILKPQFVILLTGENWANPFIADLKLDAISDKKFVKYSGLLNGSKIIVSEHPQGRPEEEHLNEIRQIIEQLSTK